MKELIQKLADGKFYSGEDLAKLLGVTRTAIWKKIKKIKGMGIRVDSVRGKGYRLHRYVDLLEPDRVWSLLKLEAQERITHFEVLLSVDSTNNCVLTQLKKNSDSFILCVAEMQTAGKGRRGRLWVSPFARNLYFSLSWFFSEGAFQLEGLSLAIGVGIIRALKEFGIDGVSLKWPNDILYAQKKLGGVLIEMVGDPTGGCAVVIGVGINVNVSDMSLEEISQPWSDLGSLSDRFIDRTHLFSIIVNHLYDVLNQFDSKGFVEFKQEWMTYSAHLNKMINVATSNFSVTGTTLGVDDRGGLIVKTDTGEIEIFYGGEVTVRSL